MSLDADGVLGLWKCPACGQVVEISYSDLADSGSPSCPKCGQKMEFKAIIRGKKRPAS